MRNLQKRPEDFEKFYYRYVGKGEACGCAERIIDINEINRLAGPSVTSPKRRPGVIVTNTSAGRPQTSSASQA